MSWVNNETNRALTRRNIFNNAVVLDQENVVNLVTAVESIWTPEIFPDNTPLFQKLRNSLISFRDSVSSLMMFPMEIPTSVQGDLVMFNVTHPQIKASEFSYSKLYANMGQIYIAPKFNNFADYKGYTHIKVFLPFLGFIDVDVNECMGKWLQFRLVVDYFSGDGMYIVGVTDEEILSLPKYPTTDQDSELRIISTHVCRMGVDIPLGTTSFDDIRRDVALGTLKMFGSAVLGTVGSYAPTTTTQTKTYNIQGRSTSKGSKLKTIKTGTEVSERVYDNPSQQTRPYSEVFNSSMDVLNINTPQSLGDRCVNNFLNWYTTSYIKVVIYRPKLVRADSTYANLYGYPLGEVRRIGSLSGYVEVGNVNIERTTTSETSYLGITSTEIDMLKNTLINGIYV